MGMKYFEAECAMREAKKITRKGWPKGKNAYYDVDGDGIPDELKTDHPDFLKKSKENYQKFLESIRIEQDGQVQPFIYITQEDATSEDWRIVE
jgi:hypothetical protein